MLDIEKVEKDGKILAIILRSAVLEKPLEFITPKEFPLQLGVHNRKKGEYVKAHEHVPLENIGTLNIQDLLIVKNGKVAVGIYYKSKFYKEVTIESDQIILINAGHSVRFLEDTEMVEIKQGPYRERDYEKRFLE